MSWFKMSDSRCVTGILMNPLPIRHRPYMIVELRNGYYIEMLGTNVYAETLD
jgi:hypothetical protein